LVPGGPLLALAVPAAAANRACVGRGWVARRRVPGTPPPTSCRAAGRGN